MSGGGVYTIYIRVGLRPTREATGEQLGAVRCEGRVENEVVVYIKSYFVENECILGHWGVRWEVWGHGVKKRRQNISKMEWGVNIRKLTLNLSTNGAMIALWNVAGTKTTYWLESTVNWRQAKGQRVAWLLKMNSVCGWPSHPFKRLLF
jgi:hypothetical protein